MKITTWLAVSTFLLGFVTPGYAASTLLDNYLATLHTPPGFQVSFYAAVPNARQLALDPATGIVYVSTRGRMAYAVIDSHHRHIADKVIPILDDLKMGNGIAVYKNYLYIAEQNRITRYPLPQSIAELNLNLKQKRQVIYNKLPDKSHHGWRYLAFGPDGKLYVTVGSPCNICKVKGIEGTIIRMNPDGSDVQIYARGIRNSVGMAFQPDTGILYFTDNNVDNMGDDRPSGELNAAPKAGLNFGFPYYAGGHDRQLRWQDRQPPQQVTFPVLQFQAHTANLGLKFYTGSQFPKDYVGDAIVAQHGSWNRSIPVGYKLIRVHFNQNHQIVGREVFIDGWLRDNRPWGRPVDVLQMPDGALLVSDDANGLLYRISYQPATIASTTNQVRPPVTGLTMPESAMMLANGDIIVSEIGQFGKRGDGKITLIHPDGRRQTIASGLNDPKGLDSWHNMVFVADVDRLIKIDADGHVSTLAPPNAFPGKPVFLNDVEIDQNGNIYVSDSGEDDGSNAGIYRITQSGKVTEILTSHQGVERPNGLLLSGQDQLLVVDFANGHLCRLDLKSHRVTQLNQGFGAADGLQQDDNGHLYISDWAGGKVWELDTPYSAPRLLAEGYQSAADIGLSTDQTMLIVPDMKAGQLDFLPISE